jgi:hypothetical protein
VNASDRPAARVRPHVARAVYRATHVLLDFDAVMFDVQRALGTDVRERAVADLLMGRPHRPRPVMITFGWFGVHETLRYLVEHDPDAAAQAETLVSELEMTAALLARRADHLGRALRGCAATGRRVAVFSDLSEPAALAACAAHLLNPHIDAVVGRQGLDLRGTQAGHAVQRAANLLGVPLGACLAVSGCARRLHDAGEAGAIALGVESGRDRRKHLGRVGTPVVSNLARLDDALRLT